jgi:hypothetical protein
MTSKNGLNVHREMVDFGSRQSHSKFLTTGGVQQRHHAQSPMKSSISEWSPHYYFRLFSLGLYTCKAHSMK